MSEVVSGADLAAALKRERLAQYGRLRGGFPVLLAGAFYWAALGLMGQVLTFHHWALLAFIGTGAIFPLALLFAALFRAPFMQDKTAVTSVLLPAFISMLLFWPMIIAAMEAGPAMVPLILAIGLSLHFPVIGWSYGRTALFCGHAIVRAGVVLLLWKQMPDARTTLLPFTVSVIYLMTMVIVILDSGNVRTRMNINTGKAG